MTESVSRRDFLLYGGATLAGITLGEMGRRQLARADERAAAWRGSGTETWATSVCRECPAACGVRVRLVDGVPVKLEGNPVCPVGRGRLCAKGQAALESYFDPDRLVGPARRVGRRGEGRWEPITWPAAIERLAAGVRRARGAPDGALALGGEASGPEGDAWVRFWTATGARVARTPAPTAALLGPRLKALTGADTDPLFDLEHATHVLSFGAPVVEDWLSPVWSQRSYGRFRRGSSQGRGRLVQLDFRRSLTARKADEWIPVQRDAQVLLAYGIASVLLRENRVDRGSLHDDGLGGSVAGFEREVIAHCAPDDVAARTGVPVVTVLRLARDLAASPRPLVIVAADAEPALVDAVLALDALVGAFDRPGGIAGSPRVPLALEPDAAVTLQAVASGELRPRLLAFRDGSVLRSPTAPVDLGALDRTDLVVSFSPFLDEAASLADLLMPAHTALEAWHALVPAPAVPVDAVAVARPAVAPRLGTGDRTALLRMTVEALGVETAAACPWKSSEGLVGAELDRLWSHRRGAPYGNPHSTEWLRQLERGGWWVPPAPSREAFGAAVLEAGGWADPLLVPGGIRESLRAQGGFGFPHPVAAASTLARPLQTAEARTRDERHPLRLVSFVPALVNLDGSPNQPALLELVGQPDTAAWQVWAEMSPETARAHSIENGAPVRIASADGAVQAVAVLAEGMPSETVALAFVPRVAGGGRWARLVAEDARRLWPGGRIAGDCAVRVTRA